MLAPGRVTTAVKTMLAGLGGEPRAATEAPSPQLAKCSRALELLLKQVRMVQSGDAPLSPHLLPCSLFHTLHTSSSRCSL